MGRSSGRGSRISTVSRREYLIGNESSGKMTSPPDGRYVRQVNLSGVEIPVLIRRCKRKTMALHVHRDSSVEMRVPLKCAWVDIDAFLESRLSWIEKSRHELAQLPDPVIREYRQGSTHAWLGARYPLDLERGRPNLVTKTADAIVVRCSKPEKESLVASHLHRWYRLQGERFFRERIRICRKRFRTCPEHRVLVVRRMKARWGSCSRTGEICLNSVLMEKPVPVIDFVITHELCHLRFFSHGRAFYGLLDVVMPDWREREKRLLY